MDIVVGKRGGRRMRIIIIVKNKSYENTENISDWQRGKGRKKGRESSLCIRRLVAGEHGWLVSQVVQRKWVFWGVSLHLLALLIQMCREHRSTEVAPLRLLTLQSHLTPLALSSLLKMVFPMTAKDTNMWKYYTFGHFVSLQCRIIIKWHYLNSIYPVETPQLHHLVYRSILIWQGLNKIVRMNTTKNCDQYSAHPLWMFTRNMSFSNNLHFVHFS